MANFLDKFTFESFDEILGFNNAKELVFALDEITGFNLNGGADTLDITGKLGRLLMQIERAKTLEITATNGMLSGGLLAEQFGGTIEDGTYDIVAMGEGTATSTTAGTATGINVSSSATTGNEIGKIYIMSGDNEGAILTQDSTASSGKFTCTISDGTASFTFASGDITKDAKFKFYYEKTVTGKKIADESDNYAGVVRLIVNATAKDICDNRYQAQIIVERADVRSEFSLEFGDNAMSHDFTANAQADRCHGDGEYCRIIVFTDAVEE